VATRVRRFRHRTEYNGGVEFSCSSIKELLSVLGLNNNSNSLRALDYLREIGWDGMNLIDLAQDRDQWRALVNTVMNLRVL
jgi:hypothetical protein